MINFGMIFASIICFILAWGFGWLLQEAAYSHLWRTMLFALVMLIATLYLGGLSLCVAFGGVQ